jgi:hypothetical protein
MVEKLTRIVLARPQAGALNKATRGFAVWTTTGVLPVTSGLTWNFRIFEAVSPDVKSLIATWI